MNACVVLLVILSAIAAARAEEGEEALGFVPPTQPSGDVYFFETFNDEENFNNKWVRIVVFMNQSIACVNSM